MRHLRSLVLSIAMALSVAPAACTHAPPPDAASTAPQPSSIAEVDTLKQRGVAWSNADVRAFYLRRVGEIGPANEAWKKASVPAEERAKRAFQMRHDARVLARAMMGDAAQVEALKRRDTEKYGTPDGPTFEWLVERNKKKGLAGDAIFEAIVESAQQTNSAVNEMFGQ